MRTLEQKAADLAAKIARQVEKGAGKGLLAGGLFFQARTQEASRVKAPTRTSKTGRVYATTKAIPGAPLRVVTGRFSASLNAQNVSQTSDTEVIVGSNAHADLPIARVRSILVSMAGVVEQNQHGFNYPKYWEVKNPIHQTFAPTWERYKGDIAKIVGADVIRELA